MRTASATRRFHLLLDLLLDDDRPGAAHNGAPERVEVPDAVAWLHVPADGTRPRCIAEPPDDEADRAIVLEPLAEAGEAYLLALAPPRRPVLVNGAQLLQVAVLRERDVIQPPASHWTLHVALHLRSTPGRPPEALRAAPCPLCGTAYGTSRIWICPACGTALHDEPDDVADAGGEPLQCLRLCSECPGCRGPLVLDGYRHLPEP